MPMRLNELMVGSYVTIPVLLIAALVQYILLRARNARAVPHDPQLGRKFLIAFFLHISILLTIVGLSYSAVDWAEYAIEPMIDAQQAKKDAEQARERGEDAPLPAGMLPPKAPRDWFNDQQRVAAGLASSGLIYTLLFWPVLRFCTNARQFPSAGRSFVGLRLMLAVIIVMVLTTVSMVGVFQKGDTELRGAGIVVGLAAIWGPTAMIHLTMLLFSKHWHRGERPRIEEN